MNAFLRKRGVPRNGWPLFGAVVFAVMGSLWGCAKDPATRPKGPATQTQSPNEEAPVSPEAQLYEQIRSGMFQMAAASSSIEEALSAAQEAKAKSPAGDRAAFDEVVDLIDTAGSGIAEFAEDSPAEKDVVAAFAIWDEKRLKAIDAGNDAMHDLREAAGALADLEESGNRTVAALAREVRGLVLVAIDDLWGAVEGFGGRPESEDPPMAP